MASNSEEKKNDNWKKYIWNSEKGTVLGRTPLDCGLLVAFYLIFYIALALWMTALLAIFYETVNQTEPKWYGEESLTQNNPGIGIRPMPMYDSTLIRFQQGKPSSYKPYTDHLEAYLIQYESKLQQGRDLKDCALQEQRERSKACRVDLDAVLGSCTKEKDFGYEDGEPCILIKMNRVFNFTPEAYASKDELMKDNDLKTEPRFMAFTPGYTVGVSCDGENAADKENLEEIKFYPQNDPGIPTVNYPYINQEGYRSPFIMIQFKRFTKRVIIQMTCTLYAKNIVNTGTARRDGTIRFELLKD